MTSALVFCSETSAIRQLETSAWREDLLSRARAGGRLLTLYGRALGDEVELTSVFNDRPSAVAVTRTRVNLERGYHELTTSLPAMHCFEREVHEQTGLPILAHPWLKPIRYQNADASQLGQYPFYKIDGKEVHEVAVGPIHAGVIEPGSFRFMCEGERVHHLEIQLGYQHRGVERELLARSPFGLTPLVETIAGDSSVAHAWAHCRALEALADRALAVEVDLTRAVALELERVGMHLATLAGLAADIGFLQGATSYGRLRTTAINTLMRLCGSRFGRGAIRPGGVRLRLNAEEVALLSSNIELLLRDLRPIDQLFLNARGVRQRLEGLGTVTEQAARALGLVGVAARASGVAIDLRTQARDGAYSQLPIESCVVLEGDCWARARVRIAEMAASLSWLRQSLESCRRPQPRTQLLSALAPSRLAIAAIEGLRGEVVHCLETNQEGKLIHYKVQDPSLRNWQGLALAVRGADISDFPICNKSFDLSYCGNDL